MGAIKKDVSILNITHDEFTVPNLMCIMTDFAKVVAIIIEQGGGKLFFTVHAIWE
jgi:hypothetical protein